MAARLALRAPVVVQPVEEAEQSEAIEEVADAPTGGEAPVGPSVDEENSFLAADLGEPDFGRPTVRAVTREEDSEPTGELPDLAALNQRIPAKVLEAMDELFRAKFTRVERVSTRHLKKG